MHCTMDDLLALRDGEGSVWARRHSEDCAACRAELEALYQRVAQLKALPTLRPPRDRWGAVRGAIVAQRTRRRRRWGYGLATAAALVGVMVIGPALGNTGIAEELAQAKQRSAQLDFPRARGGDFRQRHDRRRENHDDRRDDEQLDERVSARLVP